jgi:hypothetical protein
MGKEIADSIADLERQQRARDDAADLARNYQLPPEIAERVIAMSASIDQAHAIAELMR